jgi:hypothetical protein
MSDDYETQLETWEMIRSYIPSGIIWDPFYCNGLTAENFRKMKFDFIHDNQDFFTRQLPEFNTIVTNPPFSKKKQVMEKLFEIDKPFIVILPCSTITYKYFRDLSKHRNLQVIIPNKRIQFIKNGKVDGRCSFDCLFFCYKIGLSKDITFI